MLLAIKQDIFQALLHVVNRSAESPCSKDSKASMGHDVTRGIFKKRGRARQSKSNAEKTLFDRQAVSSVGPRCNRQEPYCYRHIDRITRGYVN